MKIRSVKHRGLLRLIEDDDSGELRPDLAKRLRNILAALIVAADMDAVRGPPGWKVHQPLSILKRAKSATLTWRITTDEHQT
jgi:proteic killer suppression protein